MEVFQEEEKEKNRSTGILLIVNLIIWGIILFMVMLFNGVVHAQTNTWVDMTNYQLKYNDTTWGSFNNGATTTPMLPVYQINMGFAGQTGVATGRIEMELYNTNISNISQLDLKMWYNGGYYNNWSLNRQFTRTAQGNNYTWHIVYEFTVTNTNSGSITMALIPSTSIATFTRFTIVGGISYTSLEQATSQDIAQQTIDIINSITNNIQNSINNNNSQYNALVEQLYNNHATEINELSATYTALSADTTDLDDLEDMEDTLNNYTDVDLDDFEVSIDTNTNNWVWNTLTSILNTSSLVFGYVISILSIGLIKLILNR